MNPRLAAFLTRAHAPAWRRRYGDEFCALLEELPATPETVASATTSAIFSQAPALVAIAAFALAAAVLALGPAASDRQPVITVQTPPPRVACDTNNVANIAPDGSVRC